MGVPSALQIARGAAAAALITVALFVSTAAFAQGVSFASPGRVPRAQDSDIGSKTTGDPSLDYTLHCQGCHQAGGVGLEGSVPELKGSVARLVSLPGGREYIARVPGVAQSQLDDAALAALLNWLMAYFDAAHLPADFRPFTAEEVGPLRKNPLVHASEVRAALFRSTGDSAARSPSPVPVAAKP
ncbi:MAG TPA: hypothetical protein VN634_07920 [Candidatus Limnocylindrales bacterium]|nr:hypothetical protein [Candidatus Limnocylindrales bacterium]